MAFSKMERNFPSLGGYFLLGLLHPSLLALISHPSRELPFSQQNFKFQCLILLAPSFSIIGRLSNATCPFLSSLCIRILTILRFFISPKQAIPFLFLIYFLHLQRSREELRYGVWRGFTEMRHRPNSPLVLSAFSVDTLLSISYTQRIRYSWFVWSP